MYQRTTNNLLIAMFLLIAAVTLRLMPHPANFAPVGAIALVGGILMARRYALWLPVLVMAISDLVIGLHPLILWTWGSFALVALLSNTLLHGKKIGGLVLGVSALSGSLIFYAITNFGVWLQGGLYENTVSGLLRCYVNALPFLRNTMLSDMFYSASIMAIVLVYSRYRTSYKKLATS